MRATEIHVGASPYMHIKTKEKPSHAHSSHIAAGLLFYGSSCRTKEKSDRFECNGHASDISNEEGYRIRILISDEKI